MKKPSIIDKKLQKTLNSPQFQQNWTSHMKSFGPILKDAFTDNPQARVLLCDALTHITKKNQPQALLKLNSLQKHLVADADNAAFFFAMGLFCEYAGKFDQMAELYAKANAYHHTFYLPYMKAGKYQMDSCSYDEAEKSYRAAIHCFPAMGLADKDKQLLANAYTNLGSCLVMMHRPEEADAALETSKKLNPLFPGRAAPEAILHALRKETAALSESLNTLKTLAPFAYDSIKKSTDRILDGTEPQFFAVPVENEKVTDFWNWFHNSSDDLKAKLDKQEFEDVMSSIGEQLLKAFPFLEQKPYVAIGKNDQGYVIQLKNQFAVGITEAYRKLLSAFPEDLKACWLFDVVH